MKIQDFLKEHGLTSNPFSQEDAREDPVFKRGIADIYHPSWDKVFADPTDPASAVVFGDKGSGKTALRLQMREAIAAWNARRENDGRLVFLIDYDDFNPFLDCFCVKRGLKLSDWRLWDHMDAILSLGVRQLVRLLIDGGDGGVLGSPDLRRRLRTLTRPERRDLLLLAAAYDHAPETSRATRWQRLRRRVRYRAWKAMYPWLAGWAGTIAVLAAIALLGRHFGPRALLGFVHEHAWAWAGLLLIPLAWVPHLWQQVRARRTGRSIARNVRVVECRGRELERLLMHFARADLEGQPIEQLQGSDARYAMLSRLQAILHKLGYGSVVVLVDRVDEPHEVKGSAQAMFDLLRPIFDLKFLKHPQFGVKLLLPRELHPYLERAPAEFHQRARLDKQNLIPSLLWTGQSLYDLANDRIRRCSEAGTGGEPSLRNLLDAAIGDEEIIHCFDRMQIPRNLFKFMFQLLNNHCMDHTGDRPVQQVGRDTWVRTWATFDRDMKRATMMEG